jgi:hypothetical protein
VRGEITFAPATFFLELAEVRFARVGDNAGFRGKCRKAIPGQKKRFTPQMLLLQFIPKHHATLHYKFHAFHLADVLERVAGNGHKVGKPSFFNVSDLLA